MINQPLSHLEQRKQRGFTLIEMIISITICGFLIVGIASMIKLFGDSFKTNQQVTETEQSVYFGMDSIVRELREAQSFDSNSNASTLIFTNNTGTVITYRINGTSLERQEGSSGTFYVVANHINSSITKSYFDYKDNCKEIVINLESSYGERTIKISNSVDPRNF